MASALKYWRVVIKIPPHLAAAVPYENTFNEDTADRCCIVLAPDRTIARVKALEGEAIKEPPWVTKERREAFGLLRIAGLHCMRRRSAGL